ncbi:MAG TPA: chemotaxis protein CheW [Trichocoleus sp.]
MTISRRVSRRLKALPASPQHQMITFPVRQDWFALPIQMAQKVFPLSALEGNGSIHEVGMLALEGQQIPLVDLEQHIYRDIPRAVLPPAEGGAKGITKAWVDPRHVLLIRLPQIPEPLGLIVSETPLLRRVPQTAFGPVPGVFLAMSQMRCISAVITLSDQATPIFLLDLNQVLPPLLPPPAVA